MLSLLATKILLVLSCVILMFTTLSADTNLTESTIAEMSAEVQRDAGQQKGVARGNDMQSSDICVSSHGYELTGELLLQQAIPSNNSYDIGNAKHENYSAQNDSIIDITSVIITVIAVVVALLTFLLTTAIPLLFRFYQRYISHITETEYQLNIIKRTNSILSWYDLVTDNPSQKNTLRVALDELTGIESDIYTQKKACAGLAQLLSTNKQHWQEELRNLLCFMIFCGKIPNEVKYHIGWQTLDENLKKYGVTGKLPEFSAPQNFRKRVFAAQDMILFFVFFASLMGLLLVVIFKVS